MASKRDTPAEQGESSPDQSLSEFVASLPEDKKLQLIQMLEVSRVETTFSGPLPSPEDFKKYNEVLPDAANRLMALAEKEQQIRADGQAEMLANDRRRITGGLLLGMSLVTVAGLATWLGYALIALPIGLAGVLTAFVRQVLNWLDRRRG